MYILTKVKVLKHNKIGVIMGLNEDGSYSVIMKHEINNTLQGYIRMNYKEEELEEVM